jgi:hypothetical protein
MRPQKIQHEPVTRGKVATRSAQAHRSARRTDIREIGAHRVASWHQRAGLGAGDRVRAYEFGDLFHDRSAQVFDAVLGIDRADSFHESRQI